MVNLNNTSGSAYVQLFRNGFVEYVDILPANLRPQSVSVINNVRFESRIMNSLKTYLNRLRQWSIEPPYLVMLTLIGVRNHIITDRANSFDGLHPIDRDALMLPDILVDESQPRIDSLLRPMFDAIWQASGLSGSWNYDKDGSWKARVH